jgi:hypothetical protein
MSKHPYKRMKVNGRCIDRHRYVMEQHLGRKLRPDEIVHHINGDKRDDRIENPELMSRSDHTKKHVTGALHGNSKLTGEDVKKIREELVSGVCVRDLAMAYNVTPRLILRIKNRELWKCC